MRTVQPSILAGLSEEDSSSTQAEWLEDILVLETRGDAPALRERVKKTLFPASLHPHSEQKCCSARWGSWVRGVALPPIPGLDTHCPTQRLLLQGKDSAVSLGWVPEAQLLL